MQHVSKQGVTIKDILVTPSTQDKQDQQHQWQQQGAGGPGAAGGAGGGAKSEAGAGGGAQRLVCQAGEDLVSQTSPVCHSW